MPLILFSNIYPMSNNIKTKQQKLKKKYEIFANELEGISMSNWKSNIIFDLDNEERFRQLYELIQSISGGNLI